MISRRDFLRLGAIVTGVLFMPSKWLTLLRIASGNSQSDQLQKFIQPLRKVGTDIKIAQPDAVKQDWWQPGVTHYTIDIGQFTDQLHPNLPNQTRLWGFGQGYDAANPNWTSHLSGVIAAKRGEPVQITFRNHLPAEHILPVDTSIMGADGAVNRADIHLHGGKVPWISDGGPHAWWDPNGNRGESFVNVLNPNLAPNEAEYYYPNDQGTRVEWYHDHTLGFTRLNAYAGMASGLVLYDDYELSLVANNNLPGPLDARTEYLIFQDKIFVSSSTATSDPAWFSVVNNSQVGDLWYNHEYDPNLWDLAPGGTPPAVSVIPEFFGDTILVNGSVYPYLEVEPREYRWRLLNACNARFLKPRLVYADANHLTEPEPNHHGPSFIQIATEGGFLPAPVLVNEPAHPELLLAPAERAELIVDFRNIPAGSTLILYNDAPAPYPMGGPDTDFYPGNPATPGSVDGYGPNTRTLMQIRVKALSGSPDAAIDLPPALTPTDPFLIAQQPGIPTPVPGYAHVRYLTLNEGFDSNGRLIQMLGTDNPVAPGDFSRAYDMEPTEVIHAGTVEVWEIINLTGDTHPIHFHLFNVQILSRHHLPLDPSGGVIYSGGAPSYVGDTEAPEDNELGWKETVRVNPGESMRVLMSLDLASVPFVVPESPRTGGHEFVWHCHILEHEEHDMMRPLIVAENKKYLPFIPNDATS